MAVITSDLRSKWRLSHQIWGQNGSYHIRSEVKMMVITSDLRLSKWMVITSDLRSEWMVITSDLHLSKWPLSHQIWGCQDEWSSHHIITEVVKVATYHIRCAWDDSGPPSMHQIWGSDNGLSIDNGCWVVAVVHFYASDLRLKPRSVICQLWGL